MDGSRFDDLTRRLATRTSRRGALKGIAGAAVALAGGIGLRGEASAAPAMSLSLTSGPVQTKVVASLTGFGRLEQFDLRWYTGSAFQVVASGGVSRSGSRSITFTVPNTPRGTHTVRAAGNMGGVANASFRVSQSIALSKVEGPRGTSVKATLRGFKQNVQVQLRFFASGSSSSTPTVLGSTTVSSTGTGTITFTVPSNAAFGSHRVEGRETVAGVLAATSFKVICTSASQCPGTDDECRQRTCANGVCGTAFTPANTMVSGQTAGDCKRQVCNGNGGVITVNDATDVPASTSQCVVGTCTQGTPGQGFAAAGTSCTEDDGLVCDGAGNCVVCVPGSSTACYTGPVNTAGVGICKAGMMTCNEQGSGYGICVDEVTPGVESTCNGDDDDCDGVVDNDVCEPVANGTSGCAGGDCAVLSCDEGFGNCDGTYATGCETDLLTDSNHCGDCGNPCPQGQVCAGGVCKKPQGAACDAPSECATGFCADNVCCICACVGICETCKSTLLGFTTDGMCVPVPVGADPFNECDGNRTCNGQGGYNSAEGICPGNGGCIG